MRKLLLIFVASVCLAEDVTPPAKKLSGDQKAALYKALSDYASAQTAANEASANLKDKKRVFDELKLQLEKVCGAPVTEKPNELADCSEPVKVPAPEAKGTAPLKGPQK